MSKSKKESSEKSGDKRSQREVWSIVPGSTVTQTLNEEEAVGAESVAPKSELNGTIVEKSSGVNEIVGASSGVRISSKLTKNHLKWFQDITDKLGGELLSLKSQESAWANWGIDFTGTLKSAISKGFDVGEVVSALCTRANDLGDGRFLNRFQERTQQQSMTMSEALRFFYGAAMMPAPSNDTVVGVSKFDVATEEGNLTMAIVKAMTLFGVGFEYETASTMAHNLAVNAAIARFPFLERPKTREEMDGFVVKATNVAVNFKQQQSKQSTSTMSSASSSGTVAAVAVQSGDAHRRVLSNTGEGRGGFGRGGGGWRGRGRGRGGRGGSQLRCYECNGFGHFARDCANKKRGGGNKEVKDDDEYVYRPFYSGVLALQTATPLSVMAGVSAGGRFAEQQVFLDTGAAPALVSPTFCAKFQLKQLASNATHVTSVSGERIPVTGEVAFRVRIGGATRALTALVAKTPFDCLIGVKVMRQFGVSIRLDKKRSRVRVSGGYWVYVCDDTHVAQRKAVVATKSTANEQQTQSVNLVLGCEQIVADVLRQERANEGSIAKPWTLPQLAAGSINDDDDLLDGIGSPKLSGSDLQSYQLVDIGDGLSDNGKERIREIALRFKHIFGGTRGDGASILPPLCKIDKQVRLTLKQGADLSRVKAHAGRVSLRDVEVMDDFVHEMLAAGALEPAPDAPCSSKAFVVQQGAKSRVVVHFGPLNANLHNNANVIPRLDDIVSEMASKDFELRSKSDMFGLYHAFAIEKDSRPLTATLFMTKSGPRLLQWTRIPLGLCSIPGLLHPLMVEWFELDQNFRQFFDDTSMRHKGEQQCVMDFERFCTAVDKSGLTISASKCFIGHRKLEILGKLVGQGTIEPLPDYLSGIIKFEQPKTVTQLQSFLGMINALTPHVQHHMRQTLAPLEEAKGGRGKLTWTTAMHEAFLTAKKVVTSPEVVVPFDPRRELMLITDASEVGGSITFAHLSDDEQRFEIVDSFGHKFTKSERNWRHISEKELLMLKLARRRCSHLFVGRRVFWVNDTDTMSKALSSVSQTTSKRVLRSLLELQDTDIRVIQVSGDANMIGDALSRNPAWEAGEASTDVTNLCAWVAAVGDAVDVSAEREEGELDEDALKAFTDDFDAASRAQADIEGHDDEAEERVLMQGGDAFSTLLPQGRPPASTQQQSIDNDVDEPDLQFSIQLDQEIVRARILQHQHEDKDFADLLTEAKRRAEARANDALQDDFAVAGDASWFERMRPELDSFGMLYVCIGDERHWRLAVPKGCRDEILHLLHAGSGAGHWGPRRTLATACRFFWWSQLYVDVMKWCKSCVPCQRVRIVRAPGNLGDSDQQHVRPVRRLESVVMDTFVVGNVHFLSMIDAFSGLVVTAPLRDQTSNALAQAFQQSWLMYFSAPLSIHADGGSEFKRHCAALCTARGIALVPGTPRNPQSVSRVSRVQRTLLAIVSKRRAEGSTQPIETLVAAAAEAINAAPSDDEHRVSPYQLMFGQEPRLPLVAFVDIDLTGLRATSPLHPLQRELQAHSQMLRTLASVRQEQRDAMRQRSQHSYALQHGAEFVPQPGDWVWAHLPDDVGLAKDERLLRWSGPWEVLSFDQQHQRVNMCFVLASGQSNKLANCAVHVRNVRPYSQVAPIDDMSAPGSAAPFDWETRAAPLGGLSMQPESVQKLLRNAAKLAEKQAKLAEAERRREEEKEREAMRQRAEAERQAALDLERQQLQARKAEEAARAREQKAAHDSLINKVLDVSTNKEGVKVVVVQRNDGSRTSIRRDHETFKKNGFVRSLVLDYEAMIRSRTAGQRALRVAHGAGGSTV